MSTFELQSKLKDELIDKIYFQCNSQLYKWLKNDFSPFLLFQCHSILTDLIELLRKY